VAPARVRLALPAAALAAALACGVALAEPYGRVAGNPADRLAALPIEDYRYDHAKRCRARPSRGALLMTRWLERSSLGLSWGIMRCEKLGRRTYSLHAEGRAIDWHLSVHDPAERRAARRLVELLLATDRAGSPHALARRMGVQEIIWNCRSWWSGAERMRPYSACFDGRGRPRKAVSDTLAHRDHVHIGLNLPGARARTSFWSRSG
jgi:hypothetical protein